MGMSEARGRKSEVRSTSRSFLGFSEMPPPRPPVRSVYSVLSDATETAFTKKVVIEHTFDSVLKDVGSPVGLPVAELPDFIGKFRVAEHTTVLGEPTKHFAESMDLSSPVSDVAGAVATELPLPFDQQLRDARKALCLAGMLAAALLGDVNTFGACLKLYTRDKAIDLVKKKVHEAVFGRQAGA